MKNLKIFELCIEVNRGWRSRNIKIGKADQEDMFEVAPINLYHVYVFTNVDTFTVVDSDTVLATDGISVTGLDYVGEDGIIAEENGYKNCFFYVSYEEEKDMAVIIDILYLNDFSLAGFRED